VPWRVALTHFRGGSLLVVVLSTHAQTKRARSPRTPSPGTSSCSPSRSRPTSRGRAARTRCSMSRGSTSSRSMSRSPPQREYRAIRAFAAVQPAISLHQGSSSFSSYVMSDAGVCSTLLCLRSAQIEVSPVEEAGTGESLCSPQPCCSALTHVLCCRVSLLSCVRRVQASPTRCRCRPSTRWTCNIGVS
jgi:hypothetical protein